MGSRKKVRVEEISEDSVKEICGVLGEVPLSLIVALSLEGKSKKEISNICGLSVVTIRKRLQGWSLNELDHFKRHKADFFLLVEKKWLDVLISRTETGGLSEVEFKDIVNGLVKLCDRERVERGLSSGRSVNFEELDEREKMLQEEERQLRAELEKSGKVSRIK